jgi:SAM-dependent methyltransferase
MTSIEFTGRDLATGAALPFPDSNFTQITIDRALQHADDLAAAIDEIWRVAAPGARIVALEPDWDTLVIDAGPLATTRSVTRAFADQAKNPAVGRQLARRLRKLGATDVQIEPHATAVTDYKTAESEYRLTELATAALPGSAARSWLATLKNRDAEGTFLAAVTYFRVSATRPA